MKKLLLVTFFSLQFLTYAQNYNFLGTYNSEGVPDYLVESDEVSQSTLDMIAEILPEGYPVPDYNPHYISSGYDTDVLLQDMADVWVTFVGEGAGYRNVLGFYTYDINNPSPTSPSPEDITIVFPNVSAKYSGGGLEVGNKVKIGTFPAGTGIGWVLLANAWSNGSVGNGLWQLYSNPDYNPEANPDLRFHNVLLSDPENERIILGFEDIRRDYASCDQDFNDALFYITANPYEAIITNNFADVKSATDVTSANTGGLESNGDLASLIAKRNFTRTKNNTFQKSKKNQQQFKPGTISYQKNNQTNLSIYFPETGFYGTENSFVSSPEDLIGITNATAVFSVDYYQGENRVAAALSTATSKAVYDHSKTICDRLNGSQLLDVRTVTIQGHKIISTRLKRAGGEEEIALTFSIKLNGSSGELMSFWNIDGYPEGEYLNFQIWGSTMIQVANLTKHILDTFSIENQITSTSIEDQIPTVFVEDAYYESGKLFMSIINRAGTNELSFRANMKETETGEPVLFETLIPLSGEYKQDIEIATGNFFDAGISVSHTDSNQLDAFYMADGPWGLDFIENTVYVDKEVITSTDHETTEDQYAVERSIELEGEIKETLNVFRNIKPGELTFDASSYSFLEFHIRNDKPIEVILVTEGLSNWNDRMRYTIDPNADKKLYSIGLNEFSNGSGTFKNETKIKGIVFSLQGDYTSFDPFYLKIEELAFNKNQTLGIEEYNKDRMDLSVSNYPNPFSELTSVSVPDAKGNKVSLSIFDHLGRLIRSQEVQLDIQNSFEIHRKDLTPGIYLYELKNSDQTFKGRFVIK